MVMMHAQLGGVGVKREYSIASVECADLIDGCAHPSLWWTRPRWDGVDVAGHGEGGAVAVGGWECHGDGQLQCWMDG